MPADWDDATSIADAIGRGVWSAVESIDEHRRRFEDRREINAFISTDWAGARARAAARDDQRKRTGRAGPLEGVPISVKDIIAVEGIPLTLGSLAFEDNIARATAPAVAALEHAGGIVVGKSNLPEFAMSIVCDNRLAGATRNPVVPGRSPGGSSGGDAAAVASGIVSLGIGTDYGGSLRWPAACTGTVALRPTASRVPGLGQVPGRGGSVVGDEPMTPGLPQSRMQTIGVIARSVRDLGLALGIMGGGRRPSDLQRLRVGWSAGESLGPVRAETVEALRLCADHLGAPPIDVGARLRDCLDAYSRWRSLSLLSDHVAAIAGREEKVAASVRSLIASSSSGSADSVRAAEGEAERAQRAGLSMFESVDVLLIPVAGGPVCDLGGRTDVDGRTVSGWELMVHCRAITLLGAPAVSLPVGMTAEGWPLSIQVIAAPQRDENALAVAAELERWTFTAGVLTRGT